MFNDRFNGDLFNLRIGYHIFDFGNFPFRVGQDPGASQVLYIADRALLLFFQFVAALLQTVVQFIETVF